MSLDLISASNDYIQIGIWSLDDKPFAESFDVGNTSGWGLNNNWRNIASEVNKVHTGFEIKERAAEPSHLSGKAGLWLKEVGADKHLYLKDIDNVILDSGIRLATMDDIFGLDWQESVKDRYDPTGSLPATPSEGDRYISIATANGWTDKYIYEYINSAWTEIIPNEGFCCEVEDENIFYYFDGTNWVVFASIMSHNSLSGLQGGVAGEYYHLSSAQHTIAVQEATDGVAGYVGIGIQTFGGVKTFGSFPVTPSAAPTTDYQVANKKYVDDNAGSGSADFAVHLGGNAYVANDILIFQLPAAITLSKIVLGSAVAPTGANLIGDVHYHATDPTAMTTIFTTQANRPEIVAAGFTDDSGVPNVASLAADGWIGLCIDQIGSTITGGPITFGFIST